MITELLLRLKPTTDIAETLGKTKNHHRYLPDLHLKLIMRLDNAKTKLKQKKSGYNYSEFT